MSKASEPTGTVELVEGGKGIGLFEPVRERTELVGEGVGGGFGVRRGGETEAVGEEGVRVTYYGRWLTWSVCRSLVGCTPMLHRQPGHHR